jgi:hypothetical protein
MLTHVTTSDTHLKFDRYVPPLSSMSVQAEIRP